AADAGFEVYMMTPDKDFGQLVREHVYLYKPSYMGKGVEVWGVPEVLARWGIRDVMQVTDILGLMGDASDNIPGVPGVGEKTAKKLLAEWETVENLVANADKLKGKLGERVRENAEQALMSKELATIVREVPVDFDPDALRYTGPDKELLRPLLDELEFRTLARRLLDDDDPTGTTKKGATPAGQISLFDGNGRAAEALDARPPAPTFTAERDTQATYPHRYHVIDTPALRTDLIHFLELQEEFCFDVETDRLEAVDAELVGLAFAYRAGEAYYVPLPEDQTQARAVVDEFRPVLEAETITKIGQNLKFDITVLRRYGVRVGGPLFDTMLAHYLIAPEMRHNLDLLAERYLNYTPVPIEALIGKRGKGQKTMREVPVAEVAEYAGEDADLTLRLKHHFADQLEPDAERLLREIEAPLVPVLTAMELAGVRIDHDALADLSVGLGEAAAALERRVHAAAGEAFNLGSPKQLGEILFDKLKISDKPKKTKSGQYATNEQVLSGYVGKYPIVRDLLDYRELQKLKSTYVDALPALINPRTGRVHTSFNQAVTVTGRLSSSNPNLQNIPIRTAQGREIRKAFVPRDEQHVILAADYSQIELRIMAAFSGDESMTQAFREGRDVHATSAAKVYGVALADVTPEQRRNAKTLNFAIIYGVSAFGLAQRLDLSRQEAAATIEAYFKEFPAIKTYMDGAIEQARQDGYVST
ncbi:MAG: DNA polymerase I, partial [Catalinimonas sp.]